TWRLQKLNNRAVPNVEPEAAVKYLRVVEEAQERMKEKQRSSAPHRTLCWNDDVGKESGLAPRGLAFCHECAEPVATRNIKCPQCVGPITTDQPGDGKLTNLRAHGEMEAGTSHRFLIFIQWSDLAKLFTKVPNTFEIVTAKFQHHEAVPRPNQWRRIALFSVHSMTGLNMQLEKQGVALTLRNGQTKTVKIVRIVAENSDE
ncbi:hypothetical protein BC830DRAFT_1083410, partial [Chytriomyces sp. MP71]